MSSALSVEEVGLVRSVLPKVAPSAQWLMALAEMVTRAEQRWPDIHLERATFIEQLLRTLAGEGDALMTRHSDDLYLALACGRGDAVALRTFERECGPTIDEALSRVSNEVRADARQALLERLFVGESPKILAFAGLGSLRGWVRVTAARVALNTATRVPLKLEPQAATQVPSGELDYLKGLYGAQFRALFPSAVKALSSRERNLLRYRFLDGLTVDDIGTIYGVHRATAARQVAKAQDELLRVLTESFKAQLRVDSAELEGLFALVRSQFDVSLRQLLVSSETLPTQTVGPDASTPKS